jgi:hypothetical protein
LSKSRNAMATIKSADYGEEITGESHRHLFSSEGKAIASYTIEVTTDPSILSPRHFQNSSFFDAHSYSQSLGQDFVEKLDFVIYRCENEESSIPPIDILQKAETHQGLDESPSLLHRSQPDKFQCQDRRATAQALPAGANIRSANSLTHHTPARGSAQLFSAFFLRWDSAGPHPKSRKHPTTLISAH